MARKTMANADQIPPTDRRILDILTPDRENIYRAWHYGRMYGRLEVMAAVGALPPIFGTPEKVLPAPPDREDAA